MVIVTSKPAWSFSRLNAFETCPKQFYHTSIAKDVKVPESPEQKFGNELHKAMEKRLGSGVALTKKFDFMEPAAAMLEKAPGKRYAEMQIAIDQNMQVVDWFAPTVWARAIVDLAIVDGEKGIIIDWKTGAKMTDDFTQQQAAAALTFVKFPQLQSIEMGYYWTKHMKLTRQTIVKDDIRHVWSVLLRKIRPYVNAHATVTFPPRPSGLCKKHCAVVTCPHNGAYA